MSTNEPYAGRAAELGQLLATKPLVRAINFHNTSPERAHIFGRQLETCSRYFSSVSEDDLDAYLQTGHWHKDRPGVILAFYEGYRNGYDIVRPMLEKLGLTGWFFVITGFVNAPPEAQLDYAFAHDIGIESYEYEDGRYAMSWNELRELDESHVIASHAQSHESIAPMSEQQRVDEVVGSQQSFVDGLGHPVRTFVSRGGPAYGEHAPTDRLMEASGYQFVFSNFRIQRLRDKMSP
jgi:peptidoglycan/xylan/chitin deacetylase (PgdA/CDA1 family)